MIRYFVSKNAKSKKRAHIWIGRDTACRMASTGGLNSRKYMVADSLGDRTVCVMCAHNFAKDSRGVAASNPKRVVWDESWDDVWGV